MVCGGVVCNVYNRLNAVVFDVKSLNPFGCFDGNASMCVHGDG